MNNQNLYYRVVNGTAVEPNAKCDREGFHAVEHGHHIQLSNGSHLEVIGGILREECQALMSHVHNWTPE